MHVEPTLPSRHVTGVTGVTGGEVAVEVRAVGAVAAAVALVAAMVFVVRRVEVVGQSMAPAFRPGDRLLVARAPQWLSLRAGDVVAAPDPRTPARLLVKRVVSCAASGVVLAGDDPARSTDSRAFGALERRSVWGIVRYRYAPASRSGVVARGPRGS